MKSAVALSALAAVAVAVQPKFLNSNFQVVAGQPFTLKFDSCQSGCTIVLQNGPQTNTKDVKVLTSDATGGAFTFTPSGWASDTYNFKITNNANPSEYNFSLQFSYQGDGSASASSASASASGSASGSVSSSASAASTAGTSSQTGSSAAATTASGSTSMTSVTSMTSMASSVSFTSFAMTNSTATTTNCKYPSRAWRTGSLALAVGLTKDVA
ncbi:hypothetical protein UVI_02052650 [Ustilaginoidea virens]|uniref:Yeast cell wall synthesis Kre9/Knh1-like N-terminal domain-containing protein n=1 Tax=Ustilaginoidea virens TaxID=1159556 RepID=A0A1B5L6Z9_USTVR|nr:hypothetical protein UVI_02052650 [Ustilaginoidea virens]